MALVLPSGVANLRSLAPSPSPPRHLSWSPDGRSLAGACVDGAIRVWDSAAGTILAYLAADAAAYITAWTPDGTRLASTLDGEKIAHWHMPEGTDYHVLPDSTGVDVAWLPTGGRLVVAYGPSVRLVHPDTGHVWRAYAPHPAAICSVTCSSDRRWIATGSTDGVVRVLPGAPRPLTENPPGPRWELTGHNAAVHQVAASPDGCLLASVSLDGAVRLWDPQAGVLSALPYVPSPPVLSVSFSPDGRLLAGTTHNGHIHLWRCDTGRLMQTIELPAGSCEAVFHPTEPILAIAVNGQIQLLTVHTGSVVGMPDAVLRCTKVVFAGDQGVGKTTLIQAIERRAYGETAPTGGRATWLHDYHRRDQGDGCREEDQILFCELGDQHGHTAIDQLHLGDADVAVVVFDARNDLDPYESPRHWATVLKNVQQIRPDRPLPTWLVLARTKLATLDAQQLQEQARRLGYLGAFRVDAEDEINVADLRQAILSTINWQQAARVGSADAYFSAQSLLLNRRRQGLLLLSAQELYDAYLSLCPGPPTGERSSEWRNCLRMAERRGLIHLLNTGGTVLLQPEVLEGYAAALIQAAATRSSELAYLPESAALCERLPVDEELRVDNPDLEQALLRAVIEVLIYHGIAQREELKGEWQLCFWGQLARRLAPVTSTGARSIAYKSDRPLYKEFMSLVARLAHADGFSLHSLWRNGANFETVTSKDACMLWYERDGDEVVLSFPLSTAKETRETFVAFTTDNLSRGLALGRLQKWVAPHCPICGAEFPPEQISARRARCKTSIRCNLCDDSPPVALDSEWRTIRVTEQPSYGGAV